jgi:uncharacterized protein YifN (PemK superfamily)
LYAADPVTGAPIMSDPLGPRRLSQHINMNHNLMLHEQLFPAASRITGYIIPEVTLDRLSRYVTSVFYFSNYLSQYFDHHITHLS